MTEKSNFFASGQCLGYNLEKGIKLTNDICYPSEDKIFQQTENLIKKFKPNILYIAADGNPMIEKFQKYFAKKYDLKIIKYNRPLNQSEGEAAHIDLYILSIAKNAIVNCPSTFSAFAKRQRDVLEKSTDFWGIENENSTNEPNSDL
jgi:peptide-O-fucosyltransferase